MGQYFNAVLARTPGVGPVYIGSGSSLSLEDEIHVYQRVIDMHPYIGAKLMEHSWWDNMFCNCIAEQLYDQKGRLAWVGDYFDPKEHPPWIDLTTAEYLKDLAWESAQTDWLSPTPFVLDGTYIVNYDKRVYLDCDAYRWASEDRDGYCIHPLPLLTALGNGNGAGDYRGDSEEYVGSWSWDLIEILEKPPEDYDCYNPVFRE